MEIAVKLMLIEKKVLEISQDKFYVFYAYFLSQR